MHSAVLADFSRCLHVKKAKYPSPSDLGNRMRTHPCEIRPGPQCYRSASWKAPKNGAQQEQPPERVRNSARIVCEDGEFEKKEDRPEGTKVRNPGENGHK